MTKLYAFLAGAVYLLSMVIAVSIAAHHTLGNPLDAPVSGYAAIVLMVGLPQASIAIAAFVLKSE